MKVSIEKTEQFALFRPDTERISIEDLHKLCEDAHSTLIESEINYCIFDFTHVDLQADLDMSSLIQLHESLQKTGGLFIAIHHNPDLIQVFEENNLLLVPSENEAIEYVMMDQLEKQFLTDAEEEE